MNNVLEIKNLDHQYGTGRNSVPVLRDVDLQLERSELLVVQGESGCGKTTLLLICGGMLKPTRGNVFVAQQAFFKMSAARQVQFRAANIGFLFQTLQLVPYLSVIDNVRLVHGVSTQVARRWLERLGLGDHLRKKPESLSHGQRQRVALARAIAHQPALVIADEPTGNLDATNTQRVFDTLREFASQGGAVLVASHNPSISHFADRIVTIQNGHVQNEPVQDETTGGNFIGN